MNEPVKFSILTPWLPNRPSIYTSIECIDNQTYDNWEHLISVDREGFTLDVVPDTRRKIINCVPEHRNWGNGCRHMLWEHATGEWILYLDDDDLLFPNCLEEVAKFVQDNTTHSWGYFSLFLGHFRFFNYPPAGGLITGGQVFHRKHLLNGVDGRWYDNDSYGADWELVSQILMPSGDPILIEETLGKLPSHSRGAV